MAAQVPRERVLAFRLAAQRLSVSAAGHLDVAASWGLQDSPPGTAAAAVGVRTRPEEAARLPEALLRRRTLVELYNPRTATAVVPAAEAGAFGAAHLPADDAGLRALLGPALPKAGMPPAEAARRTGEAVREALDGRVLSRDELHEQLRRRLPADLLPWCPGCRSHHAKRGLLVAACLRGDLCLAGRAGRQPAFARPDQWLAGAPARLNPDEAVAELGRRYLRVHGPSTPGHLSAWAGLPPAHARRAFDLLGDELVTVEGHGHLLRDDAAALQDPPPHAGTVLLAPGDPLLLSRDRELLVPDGARRKVLWRAINAPGAVLADGEIAGTWRARTRGGRVAVSVEAFRPLDSAPLDAAARRLAAARGAAERPPVVEVSVAG